jgi:hypothetical protein
LSLELSYDDKLQSVAASYKRSIDALNDTIVVDTGTGTGTQDHHDLEDSQKRPEFLYPLTPELTPEPEIPLGTTGEQAVAKQPTRTRIPTRGLLKGLDLLNVTETLRRHNEQRESYATSIVNLYYNSAYHAAFVTATNHQHVRIYRTELLEAPYN